MASRIRFYLVLAPGEQDWVLFDVVPDVLDGGERRPKVLVGVGHSLQRQC